jgi:prepilin-type N-terminal cleavage/methylation domain-containing protein
VSTLDPMQRQDDGFTLIEIVITVALVSIAFVAILTAVAGMIAAGAENQHASTAEVVARNAGEFIKSRPYVACAADPKTAYEGAIAASGTFPTSYAITVSVAAWDGNSPATFTNPCPGGSESGIEMVTVTATSTGGPGASFKKTLAIVKRKAT